MEKIIVVISVILLFHFTNSVKLPEYFIKCKKSDQKLNDCVLKNILDNWKVFVEGDNYHHIQKMNPLHIPFVHVAVDENLYGNLTNGNVFLMDKYQFLSSSIDLDNKHWEFKYIFDKCLLTGNYEVAGKLIGLPISGNGIMNITFVGGEYLYKIDYQLIEKHDKQIINIINYKMDYTLPKRIEFKIRFFGSSIGEILSETLTNNWKELGRDIQDQVIATISGIFTEVLNGFFDRVPYEEFFLPE